MIDLSKDDYTHKQVYDQLMGKDGSRRVSFKYDLLNRDGRHLGVIDSCTGSVDYNSLAQIKGTARFTMRDQGEIDFLNDRLQPVFVLHMPDGAKLEWPLGVYLLSSPVRSHKDNSVWRDITAYDKTLILREDCFDDRYYIPAGTRYTDAVGAIISSTSETSFSITDSSLALRADKEFELGTSKLDAINDLLKSVNYTSIYTDTKGLFTATPYSPPDARPIDIEYRTTEISVIYPGADDELDLFAVPNKFVVISSTPDAAPLRSVFINDSDASPLSTVNRGRVIMADVENLQDVANQATLDAYTRRKANESTQVYGKVRFDTMLMPVHGYLNILFLQYDPLDIRNRYTETSWSMDLKVGGVMSHNCRREVQL